MMRQNLTRMVDGSKLVRAVEPVSHFSVCPRHSRVTGGQVWDVRLDGQYVTGGFETRSSAEEIANLFRGEGGAS